VAEYHGDRDGLAFARYTSALRKTSGGLRGIITRSSV